MIQDIHPHKLDNHYDPAKKPDADRGWPSSSFIKEI